MSESLSGAPIPARHCIVEQEELSFLWYQAAGAALVSLGVVRTLTMSDAERLDCVARLGKILLKHADVLSDESVMVMDRLVVAAAELTEPTRQ
ncbi:hypothetical protein LWC34_30265 [Kibdelosporangium philippinense]|uniref:Uncharacterized protein n=1 Tax=Kibdelosporangium philippinense TaxID=211113 RepID=A0ABS8ZGX6_9PSEU|nr:hypothetical protein [Kibdelosporangium philippinense]MCE7007081.1 hypothetical protein [Kibdelosporangium philippinense]